jgi:hypothetical protein
MAKYAHQQVLDNGLNYIKNNCNKVALISSYSAGESYATVAAKILAEADMTSTDFTLGSSGNNRTLTSAAGKSDTAANATGGSATNHIAFLNTTGSEVLWVTEETSGQVVTTGNPVNFPSLVYTSNQPT